MKFILLFLLLITVSCGKIKHELGGSSDVNVNIPDSKQSVIYYVDMKQMYSDIKDICVDRYKETIDQDKCIDELFGMVTDLLNNNKGIKQ